MVPSWLAVASGAATWLPARVQEAPRPPRAHRVRLGGGGGDPEGALKYPEVLGKGRAKAQAMCLARMLPDQIRASGCSQYERYWNIDQSFPQQISDAQLPLGCGSQCPRCLVLGLDEGGEIQLLHPIPSTSNYVTVFFIYWHPSSSWLIPCWLVPRALRSRNFPATAPPHAKASASPKAARFKTSHVKIKAMCVCILRSSGTL